MLDRRVESDARVGLDRDDADAVAVAAWLSGRIEAENPVVIVSGGNVAAETAAAILARR